MSKAKTVAYMAKTPEGVLLSLTGSSISDTAWSRVEDLEGRKVTELMAMGWKVVRVKVEEL